MGGRRLSAEVRAIDMALHHMQQEAASWEAIKAVLNVMSAILGQTLCCPTEVDFRVNSRFGRNPVASVKVCVRLVEISHLLIEIPYMSQMIANASRFLHHALVSVSGPNIYW